MHSGIFASSGILFPFQESFVLPSHMISLQLLQRKRLTIDIYRVSRRLTCSRNKRTKLIVIVIDYYHYLRIFFFRLLPLPGSVPTNSFLR
ncbi:MAG: hypothetical protein WCA39_02105, partial [Nitrososphaeraceae archaeon]